MQDYMVVATTMGWVGVGYTEKGLWSSVLPCFSREEVLGKLKDYLPLGREDDFPGLRRDLEQYFAGEKVDFSGYPLDLKSNSFFRQQVLQATAAIPYGEVRSYKWLAEKVRGSSGASRAVGGTMASNRLPLIVPCHRVVASDGSLGGFGGGLGLKARLLELEGIEVISGRIASR